MDEKRRRALPALEARELEERREATRRAIQRNASQARGELERGNPDAVVKITGLMLRGKSLRSLAAPQIPLVYFRGRAYEELEDRESALACYRSVAAWDGGSFPLVDDAKVFVDRSVERLISLHGKPPETLPDRAPDRDPRVFPRPYLTAGRLIGAVVTTFVMVICAGILLAALKI